MLKEKQRNMGYYYEVKTGNFFYDYKGSKIFVPFKELPEEDFFVQMF